MSRYPYPGPQKVAEAVERYLAERGIVFEDGPAGQPPAAEVATAVLVCENDVRTAILKGTKIYIGPKTIVTPAARDLGGEHGVLVTTHHS